VFGSANSLELSPPNKTRQTRQLAPKTRHTPFSAGSLTILTILKSKPKVGGDAQVLTTARKSNPNSNQSLTTVSLHSTVHGVYTRTDSKILLDIEGVCDGFEHRIASALRSSRAGGSLLCFTGNLAADSGPP
jgi:hypothetical protein